MVLEIISVLLLLDSMGAILISFTRLGDTTIEEWVVFKRYLPLTKGWALLYFALSLYVAYLTFGVL